MLSTVVLTLAAATFASAETKYLVVKSDNTQLNDNTLGFPHSGAGINYAFMGNGTVTTPLDYNETDGSLTQPFAGVYKQYLTALGDFVALSVGGPNGDDFTFDSDDTLLLNGTSDGFYACMNTGDPYDYSTSSYELMYYSSDAPSSCISVKLVNDDSFSGNSASSSASTLSTSTTSASSAEPSSVFPSNGAGANAVNAAGAGAAVLGLVAALL